MKSKHSFELRAFLRALFLIFSAMFFTALFVLPAYLFCFLNPTGRGASAMQRTWARWLLKTNGIRMNLRGLENLTDGKSYILISNHASIMDIPAIIAAFPFPVQFIAKKSLIWFPIFGWFLYHSGHVLIDRESTQSALKSLKKASSLLKNGASIIVFPEGTRTPDGEVKEFKRGAFLLALQSRAAIVPVSISGTYDILPRTGWCFWPGNVQIYVDKPIPTQGFPLREVRSLADRVRRTIIQNLDNAGRKA